MENEDSFLFKSQECLSHACLFVHTSLKVFNSCLWYLDSSCSRHMIGDKSLFKSLKEKVSDYVTFGDGSHAQVFGKGTVEILGLPLLKDVLYIKGLKANLLSITQICDENFLVQFSKKGCVIINEEGIQVLEGNRTTNNCYEVVPTPKISCRSAYVDMLELWHQRFGHANFKQVVKVSKLEAIVGLSKFGKVEKTICGACQMGKQTKSNYHKMNVISTSRCLELLHVDLMGPTRTKSLGGKRYIIVMESINVVIDDAIKRVEIDDDEEGPSPKEPIVEVETQAIEVEGLTPKKESTPVNSRIETRLMSRSLSPLTLPKVHPPIS